MCETHLPEFVNKLSLRTWQARDGTAHGAGGVIGVEGVGTGGLYIITGQQGACRLELYYLRPGTPDDAYPSEADCEQRSVYVKKPFAR